MCHQTLTHRAVCGVCCVQMLCSSVLGECLVWCVVCVVSVCVICGLCVLLTHNHCVCILAHFFIRYSDKGNVRFEKVWPPEGEQQFLRITEDGELDGKVSSHCDLRNICYIL